MNSTAKDIVTILDGESSLGLTQTTDLFYARLTDGMPDDCVVVMDTPGAPPQLTNKKDTSDYYYSGVSVWVRGTKYDTAYDSLFAIMEYLHAQSQITVGTTYYALIKAVNDPQLLHYDEKDRPVLFVNFEIQRRNS